MSDDMDIWKNCAGPERITPLRGRLLRMVENQEQVATVQLVDTLEEQAVLEQLLEAGKPPLPVTDQPLHYLLKTPFRYPPLRWGSRFGRRHEPSLFYAACSQNTAMAETAFYRFVLWYGMATPPPSGRVLSEHSSFEVHYQVERGIRLQLPPFNEFHDALTDRIDYRHTQRIGSEMREAGVQAFEYLSARCPQQGLNVALYTPDAFSEREPLSLRSWLCETTGSYVAFKQTQSGESPIRFALELFLVDGRLPQPA